MLQGKKTYAVGILAILGAVTGALTGTLPVTDAIQIAVTALIGMFIRSGISSDSK